MESLRLRLGQTEAVNLKTRTLLEGEFQLVERSILNTPTRPCVEDERFSFTECLMEFLAKRVGCHLDWVGTWTLPQYPPCSSLQELERYSLLLEEVGDSSSINIMMIMVMMMMITMMTMTMKIMLTMRLTIDDKDEDDDDLLVD